MEIKSMEEKSHKLFRIGLILKGINGFLEVIGGFILLFISERAVSNIVSFLTQNELSENPKDWIADYLIKLGQNLSLNTKTFGALYLFGHGVIKLFLITELLKNKIWSYPISIVTFSLFSIYQVYRFTHTHSSALILLTVLDIIIIALISHEYRHILKNEFKKTAV